VFVSDMCEAGRHEVFHRAEPCRSVSILAPLAAFRVKPSDDRM